MSRRSPQLLGVLALLAVASAPAAVGDGTASVTVTDPCGDARATTDLVLDEHDLCAVTASIDAGGDAPVLTLAFDQFGDTRTSVSGVLAAWQSGDCGFTLIAEEGRRVAFGGVSAGLPNTVDVHVSCGEFVERCSVIAVGQELRCETVREHEETITLFAGSAGIDPVVELTFDGPLDAYASYHDSGATVVFGSFVSGPANPDVTQRGLLGSHGCVAVCYDAASDFLLTEARLEVRGPAED